MTKRRPGVRRDEVLDRSVEISSMKASVSRHADARKGCEPRIETNPWLELRGFMDEPVRDVQVVVMSVHVDDRTVPGPARPAAVGAIVKTRPDLSVVVGFPQLEFDRVWLMALLGHLKFAHLLFTRPHRNTALVISLSFSSEMEE